MIHLVRAALQPMTYAPPVSRKFLTKWQTRHNILRRLSVNWKKSGQATVPVNIVFHGHSVPSGYFKTPVVDSLNAYPNLLRSSLAKRFPHAVINVIVTAIGGENSQKGETRFASDVIIYKPDVVFIDYALNDRRIGLSTAKSAWVSMIRKAQAAGVKVILLTPTPDTSAKLGDPNDPLNLHAAQIRQLAAEYHVGLVDSLSLFKDELTRGTPLTSLMAQVNHPNAAGHKLVAEEILKWFPATPTVSGDGRNSSIRP